MFLGWYDPDKAFPTASKVREAVDRYTKKFGAPPKSCLTSVQDATEVAGDVTLSGIEIRGVDYVPRFTYYVGVDDVIMDVGPIEDPGALGVAA